MDKEAWDDLDKSSKEYVVTLQNLECKTLTKQLTVNSCQKLFYWLTQNISKLGLISVKLLLFNFFALFLAKLAPFFFFSFALPTVVIAIVVALSCS